MILVTEATGNVGREVVNLLRSSGEKVVAVTRNPAKAALPDGAHVVGGDLCWLLLLKMRLSCPKCRIV
jgi:uncharacterized protein YbjT (DUF2867 family)